MLQLSVSVDFRQIVEGQTTDLSLEPLSMMRGLLLGSSPMLIVQKRERESAVRAGLIHLKAWEGVV